MLSKNPGGAIMLIKLALLIAVVGGALCACSGLQPLVTTPDSGVTSSNGGGQRALGDTPDVAVSNGRVSDHPFSRNSVGAGDY